MLLLFTKRTENCISVLTQSLIMNFIEMLVMLVNGYGHSLRFWIKMLNLEITISVPGLKG